jgi:hypothetical protein
MQHSCGYHLNPEEVELGICPFCLGYVSSNSPSLTNFTLEEIVSYLGTSLQSINNDCQELHSGIYENQSLYEQPKSSGEIVCEYNPQTGCYEY